MGIYREHEGSGAQGQAGMGTVAYRGREIEGARAVSSGLVDQRLRKAGGVDGFRVSRSWMTAQRVRNTRRVLACSRATPIGDILLEATPAVGTLAPGKGDAGMRDRNGFSIAVVKSEGYLVVGGLSGRLRTNLELKRVHDERSRTYSQLRLSFIHPVWKSLENGRRGSGYRIVRVPEPVKVFNDSAEALIQGEKRKCYLVLVKDKSTSGGCVDIW
ncbi:hypothetical protein B0H16DRAFT_1449745 [Mycena metata]|uniref:Uncharacterized protein n=1 Tax=Mycena metata TaxID=1033252 RepID=A0AAD7NUB3_9AGAR|nr:hypothetical protein B0H16DRAFT_1449745 [Mycena metata]